MTAQLITAKEYARRLGISRATLTRYVQSGKITPAYRGEGYGGVMLFQDLPNAASSPEVLASPNQ